MSPKEWLWHKAVGWLTRPMAVEVLSPNDFGCVLDTIRAADVLLIEGRTRIGEIIARPREAAAGATAAAPQVCHETGDAGAR